MNVRLLLVGVLLIATSVVGSPAVAASPVAKETVVAPVSGGETSSPVAADHARAVPFPSLPAIRYCIGSITRLGACARTAFKTYCLGTLSKLLGCIRKVEKGYDVYQTVADFRQSDRCPAVLEPIAAYICYSTPPPAPRVAVATVVTDGRPLPAHTGPSTWFTFRGTYANGTRLGVVCATRYGETITIGSWQWAAWARLSNGLYVPAVGLSWPPDTVPWC